jgi:hypothetical protein
VQATWWLSVQTRDERPNGRGPGWRRARLTPCRSSQMAASLEMRDGLQGVMNCRQCLRVQSTDSHDHLSRDQVPKPRRSAKLLPSAIRAIYTKSSIESTLDSESSSSMEAASAGKPARSLSNTSATASALLDAASGLGAAGRRRPQSRLRFVRVRTVSRGQAGRNTTLGLGNGLVTPSSSSRCLLARSMQWRQVAIGITRFFFGRTLASRLKEVTRGSHWPRSD